jgi:hypothetical protein
MRDALEMTAGKKKFGGGKIMPPDRSADAPS